MFLEKSKVTVIFTKIKVYDKVKFTILKHMKVVNFHERIIFFFLKILQIKILCMCLYKVKSCIAFLEREFFER